MHGSLRSIVHLPRLLGNTDLLQMCAVALGFEFYFYHCLFFPGKRTFEKAFRIF